jgi:hypothetical protein
MGCPQSSWPAISCVAPDGTSWPDSTASPRRIVDSVKCSSAGDRWTAGADSFAAFEGFDAGFPFAVPVLFAAARFAGAACLAGAADGARPARLA